MMAEFWVLQCRAVQPRRGLRRTSRSGFPIRSRAVFIANASVERIAVPTGAFNAISRRMRVNLGPSRPDFWNDGPDISYGNKRLPWQCSPCWSAVSEAVRNDHKHRRQSGRQFHLS